MNYYTNYSYDSLYEKLPEPVYKIENCLFYFYILLCILLISIVFLNCLEHGQIINHADVKYTIFKLII